MKKQQIVFHRSPMERRRFLPEVDGSYGGRRRLAEVAGGTTAECAAVVCCFPCTVVNVLILVVYKLPAGLCRKVLRKKRRKRLLEKGLLIPGVGEGDYGEISHRLSVDRTEYLLTEYLLRPVDWLADKQMSADKEFLELENEMWEKFYGTGFWRSLSQRVDK